MADDNARNRRDPRDVWSEGSGLRTRGGDARRCVVSATSARGAIGLAAAQLTEAVLSVAAGDGSGMCVKGRRSEIRRFCGAKGFSGTRSRLSA